MSTLVIQSKSKDNLKLLRELARKIGDKAVVLSEEQAEDLALGTYMNKVRTSKNVGIDLVIKKIRSI
jgi:hypothetical protein